MIADLSEPSQSDAATDASKPQVHNKNGSGLINAEAQAQLSASKDTDNTSNNQIDSQDNTSKPRFRVATNVATHMYDRQMSEKQSRNREVIALSILSL